MGRRAARLRRRAGRARRPRGGHERALPRAAALGRPLRRQGSRRRGGVRRRERDPAPRDPRLHRGHRRAVRHDARRRSRVRRTGSSRAAARPTCRRRRSTSPRRCGASRGSNPAIRRAFTVPDASIDAWKTVWSFARGAAAHGARILTYHRVVDFHRTDGAVTGARVRNELHRRGARRSRPGSRSTRPVPGPRRSCTWPGSRTSACVPGKGIMIAMNHRLVNTVINRCTMPADGDILVPVRTVSVIGTTDIHSADPDEIPVTQDEVDQMLDDGERLVPGFREARALRVWAGVRPLFQDAKCGRGGRHARRQPHARRRRPSRARRHRRPAHDVGRQAHDAAPDGAGPRRRDVRPARHASGRAAPRTERPPGNEDGESYQLGSRLRRREETLQDEQLICECELIGRGRLEEAMRRRGTTNLDDIRRILRLGMGPCQGGFCIYRATGILHGVDRLDGRRRVRVAARLPAGALEGRLADPLRRPAAPGAARRLDLPGPARRRAPAAGRRAAPA